MTFMPLYKDDGSSNQLMSTFIVNFSLARHYFTYVKGRSKLICAVRYENFTDRLSVNLPAQCAPRVRLSDCAGWSGATMYQVFSVLHYVTGNTITASNPISCLSLLEKY